jgi:Flp pilus assembly protein protease CpaA
MVIVSCIIGAVAVAMASYVIISLMAKNRKLEFDTKKIVIYEVLTFAVTLAVGYMCFGDFSIVEELLQYILICAMSVIALMDFKYHFISNKLLLALLVLWISVVGLDVIFSLENGMELFFRGLIGAIIGGLIFLLCYILSKGQLGAGDVKLVFVMGLYLTGNLIISCILYGVISCFVY